MYTKSVAEYDVKTEIKMQSNKVNKYPIRINCDNIRPAQSV